MNVPPVTILKGFASDLACSDIVDELNLVQRPIRMFGREIMQPRLIALVGDAPYRYSGKTMTPDAWSPIMSDIRSQVEEIALTRYSVCLANLYRDGKDSIGWHADDEREICQDSPIVSLSFGASRVFSVRHEATREVTKYLLNHGDLLIMAPGMQADWMHSLAKSSETARRLNLTFRKLV